MLEWESSDLILNLFSVFMYDDASNCHVSYLENHCPGINMESQGGIEGLNVNSIVISEFGAY